MSNATISSIAQEAACLLNAAGHQVVWNAEDGAASITFNGDVYAVNKDDSADALRVAIDGYYKSIKTNGRSKYDIARDIYTAITTF